MTEFGYAVISRQTVDELAEGLRDGQSIGLLGPQRIGKRELAVLVREKLKDLDPVFVDFSEWRGRELRGDSDSCCQRVESLVANLDERLQHGARSVPLVATSVNSISAKAARLFLASLRTRIEGKQDHPGRLSVLVTGDLDFRRFIYGSQSELNCTRQVLLLGHDYETFCDYARRILPRIGLEELATEDELQILFDRTGGNAYLSTQFLTYLLYEKQLLGRESGEISSADPVTDRAAALFGGLFERVTSLVSNDPDAWRRLEDLIEEDVIAAEGLQPDDLEFLGVARRTKDMRLGFASKLVRELVEWHFTPRKRAEIYARNGKWSEAFRIAETMIAEDHRFSLLGVTEEENIAHALGAVLQKIAADGRKGVRSFFEQGVKLLLGPASVSFWRKPEESSWTTDAELPSVWSRRFQRDILVPSQAGSPTYMWVPGDYDVPLVASWLSAYRSDEKEALIVADLDNRATITRRGKRLLQMLVELFAQAYRAAVSIERTNRRLAIQSCYMKIHREVDASLGSPGWNIYQSMARVTKGLSKLGYRRVLVSLVDETGRTMRNICEHSSTGMQILNWGLSWNVDEPPRDIQHLVLQSRGPATVRDPESHPLTEKEAVRRVGMGPFALVPICIGNGPAIGTIHIEREDREPPTREEVHALFEFGGALATIVEQSLREEMLSLALNYLPDPIAILDVRGRPRFANEGARRLFGLDLGWTSEAEAAPLSNAQKDKLSRYGLEDVSHEENRRVRHVTPPEPHVEGGPAEVLVQPLVPSGRYGRGGGQGPRHALGRLIRIHPLGYLFGVLEALEKLQSVRSTDDILDTVLEATESLGHPGGRLYLVAVEDPHVLMSFKAFGIQDQDLLADFCGRRIRLPLEGESVLAIANEQPEAFCFDPKSCDGEVETLPTGLRIRIVSHPKQCERLKKEEGDVWVDFPLIQGKKVLGKITLDCSRGYSPEEFELLKVLYRMASSLLGSAVVWESNLAEERIWMQRASERAMSDASHHLKNVVGRFPLLVQSYRALEGTDSSYVTDLRAVTDLFEERCNLTKDVLRVSMTRLGELNLRTQSVDLVELWRSELAALKVDACFEGQESLEAEVDPAIFRQIALEMVTNSRNAAQAPESVRVSIEAGKIDSFPEKIQIVYRDDGPGIPAIYKKSIFETFWSRRPGRAVGQGLGLPFIQRVFEALEGEISEVGSPGEGAVFVMILPRKQKSISTVSDEATA